MSIRKISFAKGEFYHIYNRGNSKQKIFHDKQDYERFVGLLYACNQKDNFKVFNLGKDKTLFDVEREDIIVNIGALLFNAKSFSYSPY